MRRVDEVKTMNKPRTAVSVAFASNGIAAGSFMVRIPDFKEKLEITNGQFGLALFILMIGVLISIKNAGSLSAKFGSRTIAIPATIAMALVMLIVSVTSTYLQFTLALFLFGFALATQDISMNAHAIAVEHKYSARYMSTFHAIFSIGGLIGALIAGILSQFKVTLTTQALVVGIPVAIAAIALRNWWLPASVDIHPVEKGVKKSRRPRIFWVLGILGFCGQIGEGAAGDWGGILARDTFHASPFLSAMPYILFSLTMVIGRLFGDRITSRYSAATVLSTGGMISGFGLISGLLIGGIEGQIFGWLALGAGVSILIPILFSESGRIAREEFPGKIAPSEGVAMVSGIAYFGFMAGPPTIGFLSTHIGLRWAMLLPGVLALILGVTARKAIK
jgi:MFS family permease